MIELALRFRCDDCGVAIELPQILPQFPTRLNLDVPKETVPKGWTVAEASVHCPAHKPSRIVPATVAPAAEDMKRMLNGAGRR